MAAVTCDNSWRAADWVHFCKCHGGDGSLFRFVKSMSDFVGGSIFRRLALARLAFYSVLWPECFFPMHLLPLRQVSFCRDSLSSTRGDSGFVSSGCLALSSYPLRVGGAVTATPGAAGWEAVGRAKGGGWRTGTEPLIPLFSFPILTGRHRNYKKQTPDTHQTQHTSIFKLKWTQHRQITSTTPPRCLLFTPPPASFSLFISASTFPHIQQTHTVEAVRLGCVV